MYVVLNINMTNYYVYALIEDGGDVLYIGKGSGNRMFTHLKIVNTCDQPTSRINNHLFYKCKKILKNGGTILEEKIYENLEENEALIIEKLLIETIGLDNLCNYSPSGSITQPPEGTKTYDDYKHRMSEAAKNRWKDPKYRRKMELARQEQGKKQSGENHPMYGKRHTAKSRSQMSKSHTGKRQTPESIEKTRNALLGREITWADKISKSCKEAWAEKIDNGYVVSQATRDKISKASTGSKDKILDENITNRIVELYNSFGPNRIQKQLKLEGIAVSLFIIRRELKDSGIYKKYRKNGKL